MKHDFLRQELERKLQQEVRTPKDFRLLSERIAQETNTIISVDTLMRIWGYKGSVNTRTSTLDILAQFLGYEDYVSFLKVFPDDADQKEERTNVSACDGGKVTLEQAVMPKHNCNWVKRKGKWLTAAVCLLAVACIALGYMYFQSNEPAGNTTVEKPVHGKFLTSMDDIRNDRQY